MIEAFGPDKLNTRDDPRLNRFIEKINNEITDSGLDDVVFYIDYEDKKYLGRLKRLYIEAGWDNFHEDYDYDEEYDTVKVTLSKNNDNY